MPLSNSLATGLITPRRYATNFSITFLQFLAVIFSKVINFSLLAAAVDAKFSLISWTLFTTFWKGIACFSVNKSKMVRSLVHLLSSHIHC